MPSPLGARCRTPLGGLYRSPLGALACPALGCPEALEVTLSGVDAAICGCQRAKTANSILYSNSLVDGTYQLAYEQTDAVGCKYVLDSAVDLDYDYFSGTTCAGGGTPTTISQRFIVWLDENGSQVVQADFRTRNTGGGGGTAVHTRMFYAESVAVGLGSPVSNQLDCNPPSVPIFGYYPEYSSGGTLTAVKA